MSAVETPGPAAPERLPGDSSLTMSFSELVFSDVVALRPGSRPGWVGVLFRLPFVPGVIATIILRAQQCLHRSGSPVGRLVARVLQTVGNVVIGVDLGPGMVIGKGLRLMHPVGVTMGYGARIGDNVSLAGGVTLAARYYDDDHGQEQAFPVVEDGVTIGAHAVLVGGVRVGRNAMIGANSVVLSDVPANAVVFGVPAKRVGTREPVEADPR